MYDKKRILILGSSGLIGTLLTKILNKNHEVFTTCHKTKVYDQDISLDLLSYQSIERAFRMSKPDIVINLCVIYKNLDFCEKNKKLVMTVNGSSLKPISELCNNFNSFLVNLSTDYVFDGNNGNYKESEPVSPINYFGISKVEGEKIIQQVSHNYCIVRSSMIYGRSAIKKTLPDRILDEIKGGRELKIIYDQFMTPTYLDNFCRMLAEIIELQYQGIIHLAGPSKMSRYDFAIKLLDSLGLTKTNLIPVKFIEFTFGRKMPRDSSLNTEKASLLLKEKPEQVETSLKKYLKQIEMK